MLSHRSRNRERSHYQCRYFVSERRNQGALAEIRTRPEEAPRPRLRKDESKQGTYDLVFISFMSFMLHESPQQQHSCLAEDIFIAVLFVFAPFFMSHESPQQPQPPSLPDAVTWFFMPSFFFMSHESPQQPQQPSLSAAIAWFFIASFFIIGHESPQQLQHEAFLSTLAWFAVCANEAPANAIISPSTRAGTHRRKVFISISPERKILAGIRDRLMLNQPRAFTRRPVRIVSGRLLD
jgi:hypothetical protein